MNTIFGATFVGHWFEDAFCSLRSHGTRDKAGSIIDKGYRERWFEDMFCSLRSHGTRFAYGRLRAQALSQPCLVMGRAKVERFVFATNGTIERFGNLVRQELMNVWRDSILFASLTRHTLRLWALTRPSAQPTVPCHGKSGCLRLRSN